MNIKQIQKMQSLTRVLDNKTRILNGKPIYGELIFTAEKLSTGQIMLTASNTETKKFYHRHIFFMAIIGTRGGVKIKHNDGIFC
jgi:hypothetical protein